MMTICSGEALALGIPIARYREINKSEKRTNAEVGIVYYDAGVVRVNIPGWRLHAATLGIVPLLLRCDLRGTWLGPSG